MLCLRCTANRRLVIFKHTTMKHALALCAALLILPTAALLAQQAAAPLPDAAAPAILPAPAKMEVGKGAFTLSADTVIVADAASAATAQQLVDYLKPATGFALTVSKRAVAKGQGIGIIALTQDKSLRLGAEGYRLIVTPQSISIAASEQAGVFYGVQTLRQLLPAQIFAAQQVAGVTWSAPCVTIEDQPRFAWRGLMLDSGHDFQNLAFVFRFVDLMAAHKFNLFHWHLTDLGTWSMEVKGRPKLLEAATRGPGVKPGFYRQDEIREVVRYAAARHITIMPEIDMPGHEPPALIAYPELDCPLPREGRPWQFCVGNEKTYEFLQEVLTQVAELFPGKYIHIGGDECPKDRWLKCPVCQAKMQAERLKTGDELQSYFVGRIEKFLTTKNRRLVGWDEILEGGLEPTAAVMSWRGEAGGIIAAKSGHALVMMPQQKVYFDYYQSSNRAYEPLAIDHELPLQTVYRYEPIPAGLTDEEATRIMGGQGGIWTEYMPRPDNIEFMAYPRACALAERLWSPKETLDYTDFISRLVPHLRLLDRLNVNYRVPKARDLE